MLMAYVTEAAKTLLRLIQLLLFARAILSWFPIGGTNPVVRFLYMATEPFLTPVRSLLRRFEFLRRMPFDFSILVVYFLIELLISLLSNVA